MALNLLHFFSKFQHVASFTHDRTESLVDIRHHLVRSFKLNCHRVSSFNIFINRNTSLASGVNQNGILDKKIELRRSIAIEKV